MLRRPERFDVPHELRERGQLELLLGHPGEAGIRERLEEQVEVGQRPDDGTRDAVHADRDEVHLRLRTALAEERVARHEVVLLEVGAVRLEQPVPHFVAHAVPRHAHHVGDEVGARPGGVDELGAIVAPFGADQGDVRVDEALPVRLLAERVGTEVAGVGEHGAKPNLVRVRTQQRLQLGVGHVVDGLDGHPAMGRDARGVSGPGREQEPGDEGDGCRDGRRQAATGPWDSFDGAQHGAGP
ncbi:MAG: hypothetical protein KIT14_02175 [bacterium]|nr:hypothetical protein [bacterium]